MPSILPEFLLTRLSRLFGRDRRAVHAIGVQQQYQRALQQCLGAGALLLLALICLPLVLGRPTPTAVVVGKIELPKKTMPPPIALADTTPADAVASAPPSPSQLPTKDTKGRFVVQAGAFFEADRVKEVRRTLEQAQIDSYTQIIQTAEGKRTRIRVGPFASREDAEQMLMHIKPLGLDAVVLRI